MRKRIHKALIAHIFTDDERDSILQAIIFYKRNRKLIGNTEDAKMHWNIERVIKKVEF